MKMTKPKLGLLLLVVGLLIITLSHLNKGTFMKVCAADPCDNPVFAELNFEYDETAKTLMVASPAATVQLQKCAYENSRNWQCTNPMDNMTVTMENGKLEDNEPRTEQVGGLVYRWQMLGK